jgi:hypothetical protein
MYVLSFTISKNTHLSHLSQTALIGLAGAGLGYRIPGSDIVEI